MISEKHEFCVCRNSSGQGLGQGLVYLLFVRGQGLGQGLGQGSLYVEIVLHKGLGQGLVYLLFVRGQGLGQGSEPGTFSTGGIV